MFEKILNLIRKFGFGFVLINLISISLLHAKPIELARALSISEAGDSSIKINQVDDCAVYNEGAAGLSNCRDGEVSTVAATWLFFLVLIVFVGLSNKKKL